MNYKEVIESRYNRQKWQELLHDIFGSKADLWRTPYEISTNSDLSKQTFWLGTITLSDGETIAVYEVELADNVDIERNRRGIRDMLLTEWRNRDAGAFMFCYRKNESVLRFSYISEAWNFADDGSYTKEATDPKRFTYLLGEGHRSRTAIQQFEKLRDSKQSLKDLTKAFSVEAVSDMFFNEYKKNYEDIIEYITGKRMVKVANKWEEKVIHTPCEYIMQEFAHFPNPEKAVRDYVKKLMGRLVFLQFLQKKGWLGVPVNAEWGNGDPEFIQNLFVKCQDKDHFVDNVLEELFNDLNSERTNDLVSSAVGHNIRVPYLNGGLFEREATDETEFVLPAKYMLQMLDFFASYNFTIDENDPDDAEVGVDPEMLGRIFENLLEDNKDKGAFYTPKEIVTYMCRESLIAYLQTDIEDEETKEAIRQFVTNHEKNDKLPADTDQKLKDVKICDPAIGSGAFPMGLLKELFLCRTALEGITQSKAAEIKKHIIQQNIYGVDIERGAVDIARLRFWLSLIVDEETPQALPNLDYKIVEGNSLITTFDGQYIDLSLNWLESKRYSIVKIRPEKKALREEQKRFFTLKGDEKYLSEIAIKNHILNIIWYQLDFEKQSWREATIEQAGLFGAIETQGRKKNTAQVVEFTPERQEVLDKCEALMQQINDKSKTIRDRASISIPFFEWETVFSDIFEDENKKGFDIVIGNPPYLRIQGLHNTDENIVEILTDKFQSATGSFDFYVCFVETGLRIINSKGLVNLIMPVKWSNASFGKGLRKLLSTNKCANRIINFGEYQVFNASTYTALQWFIPNSESLSYVELNRDLPTNNELKKFLEGLSEKDFSPIAHNKLNEDPWVLTAGNINKLLAKLEEQPRRVSDVFDKIFQGLATGKDDVYFLHHAQDNGNYVLAYSNQLKREIKIERLFVQPLLKGEDVHRYDKIKTNRVTLFPYKVVSGKIELLSEIELQCNYPLAYNYLTECEKLLRSRENGRFDKDGEWFQFSRKQGMLGAKLEKLVAPDISMGGNFALDSDGEFYQTTTIYGYIKKDVIRSSYKALMAILNSELCWWFMQNTGNVMANGYYRYKPAYINPFPMPSDESILSIQSKLESLVDSAVEAKAIGNGEKMRRIETEINMQVYHLYGLNYDEVLIVDPETPITREEYELAKE
jgi:hypothetical protein